MEFIRLIKRGKLPLYQRSVVDSSDETSWELWKFGFHKGCRKIHRYFRRLFLNIIANCIKASWISETLNEIEEEEMRKQQQIETDDEDTEETTEDPPKQQEESANKA